MQPVKFSMFAHMERANPGQSYTELYEDFVDLCVTADKGGFDKIWTGEHHGIDFTITPNPFITLADLARQTKNVRLGTGAVIAPYWHPVKLAGEAAQTDVITGGRLELGLARGAYPYEYDRMVPGMDAAEAGRRLREVASLVRPLWDGDCQHTGEFYSFPLTSSSPKPLQDGGPPVWIAAREPESFAFAIEHGFNVQVTPAGKGDAEVAVLKQRFDDACAASPEKPRPQIMVLQHCFVSDDDALIGQVMRDLNYFYTSFGEWFRNVRPVSQAQMKPLSAEELAANPVNAPEALRGNLAIGSATEVIDRIKRYQDMGYDEYAYWMDSGIDPAIKRDALCRFIDEVIPAFS